MRIEADRPRRKPAVLGILLAPLTLLERSRGRRRLPLAAAYFLIVVLLGLLGWRQSRLAGLPDVGDPPLAKVGPIPDDVNAFVLYRQLKGKIARSPGVRIDLNNYQWDPKNADLALSLARNAGALATWRRGGPSGPTPVGSRATTRAGRRPSRSGMTSSSSAISPWWRRLDASRPGDMAGAWGWYRAILRANRHSARHSPAVGRVSANVDIHAWPRIAAWANDPRVDLAMLRRALADVRDANAMTSPDSETLAIEERLAIRALDDPRGLYVRTVQDAWERAGFDADDWRFRLYQETLWFLQNEPERSRRLVRLAFANWIEQADTPRTKRPNKRYGKEYWRGYWELYDSPPSAALPLPPAELGARLDASDLIRSLKSDTRMAFALAGLERDRLERDAHLRQLARTLFAREHDGREPDTDEDLARLIRSAPDPSPDR